MYGLGDHRESERDALQENASLGSPGKISPPGMGTKATACCKLAIPVIYSGPSGYPCTAMLSDGPAAVPNITRGGRFAVQSGFADDNDLHVEDE